MRNSLRFLFITILMLSIFQDKVHATVGWLKSIPATSENPQAISPDVIQNNTAVDLMLQNYRDGNVNITLASTSLINIGAGGVMLSNSSGSVRLMVANSTVTGVGPTNIDTGSISASSTYYLYAYASSVTATTFSVLFSASSTTPTGLNYYAQLGSFNTDGSANFIGVHSNTSSSYGTWTSPTINTPYLAISDGVVQTGFLTSSSSGCDDTVKTDGSNPPITGRGIAVRGTGIATTTTSIVRKGDYWEAVSGCTPDFLYFITTGS